MQVRTLRGLVGEYGSARKGTILDLADARAADLIRRGLAVPVQGSAAPATPKGKGKKEGAGKAVAHPSSARRRTGGRTGKATSSSS